MSDITLYIPQSILQGCPGGLLVEYAHHVSPHMPSFHFMLGPLLHVTPSLLCFLPLFQINSQIKVKNAPKIMFIWTKICMYLQSKPFPWHHFSSPFHALTHTVAVVLQVQWNQ